LSDEEQNSTYKTFIVIEMIAEIKYHFVSLSTWDCELMAERSMPILLRKLVLLVAVVKILAV